MRAVSHQNFGLLWGLISITLLQLTHWVPHHLIATSLYFLLVLIGSAIPDLDQPNSYLGRRLKIISIPLSTIFGHRRFTHSILFMILMYWIGRWTVDHTDIQFFYIKGLLIGMGSHIAGDFLTKSGVPLLFPLTKKRFRFLVTFKTGSIKEHQVTTVIFIINIFFILSFVNLI
ncbi:metal-dependent hydrolase [Tuberibacillus sp. Marseille-P3662]|uniref:metal-dependent hydrolase n=1 Tax=Tuberibacillus sp. Marseille-P3662 TaxID=1965358 RepID=UPI0015933922|nr:metal-dependent hydrolase [Tuberibacillus sp. Marseille-P3662]